MIDYEKLEKSLKHLELQYDNYLELDKRPFFTELDKEGISESVIQRFEVCFDTIWKYLKKYLEETGLAEVPSSPKPILKLASQNGIIDNIEDWLEYANARVATSHDYNKEKVMASLEITGNFILDAIAVYETITGEHWIPNER